MKKMLSILIGIVVVIACGVLCNINKVENCQYNIERYARANTIGQEVCGSGNYVICVIAEPYGDCLVNAYGEHEHPEDYLFDKDVYYYIHGADRHEE